MHTPGPKTFPVATGTAVERYRRVVVDAQGEVSHAGAVAAIGVAEQAIPAAAADRTRGDTIAVRPFNQSGTMNFIASGAIAVGAEIQAATDGKVATGTGMGWINITANVAADGDVLEAIKAE